MKTVIKYLIITGVFYLALAVPTTYAVGPAALAIWEIMKDFTVAVVGSMAPELLKKDPKPEEIAALKQKVAELEKKLAEAEKNRQNIPAEELQQVKKILATFTSAVNQLSVTGNKLAETETTVAVLRDQLLQLPRNHADVTTLSKPVDLELNYVYRASGQKELSPLRDGSVLNSGDVFKVIFKLQEDGYVYVFNIDAAGKLLRLFPMTSLGGVTVDNLNPVKAGQTYYLPAETKSFVLDKQTGTETIYFVVARQRDEVLEQIDKMKVPAKQFAKLMQQAKGISGIKDDAPGSQVEWPEKGQTVSTLLQHLKGACNGCVQTLKFTHR